MYFTWGTAKVAANFEDMVIKLARHVGTSPWPQSLVAPKAMSTLITPEFEGEAVPTREYWANPGRRIKTNDRTRDPFQCYVAYKKSIKLFLRKDLKKKTVGTESKTNNHLTDSTTPN